MVADVRQMRPEDDWTPSDDDDPRAPPKRTSNGATRGPVEKPSADDPLRGLKHLSKVAVFGRELLAELAQRPVRYIWQDIAVAGTIVLLAAPPAEGKTTLLFLILGARANLGAPVSLLGRLVEPAPRETFVVLIEGEHSESSTARKLVKSLRLLGVDQSALGRLIVVARKAVTLGSPEWADVVQLVSDGLVSDIALDTIARVMPADGNDEREQVALFNFIAMAIERAPEGVDKPVVWAAAHTRKNSTGGDLSDVAGSVQRTGQADTVLMLKGEKVEGRTVSTTVTFAKLREDPDDYPRPCTFSVATEGGEPTLRYVDPKNDDAPLETRIIEQLTLGPKTKNQLCQTLGRSSADVEKAISNLFSAKGIRTTTVNVRGVARKAFALRSARDPPPSEHGNVDDLHDDFDDGRGL